MPRRFYSLIKTTAVRLSALYLLLFGLVALSLALYMTSLSVSILNEQTQLALEEEIGNIEASYQHGGIAYLMRTVDRRSRQPGAFLYLVADERTAHGTQYGTGGSLPTPAAIGGGASAQSQCAHHHGAGDCSANCHLDLLGSKNTEEHEPGSVLLDREGP